MNRLNGLIRLIGFAQVDQVDQADQEDEAFRADLTLRSSVAAPDNDVAPAILLTANPAPASEPPERSIELGGDDARPDTEVRVEPPVRFEHPVSFGSPESLSPARSAVWPLSLALLVGVALGFAGGYWLGQSAQRGGLMDAAGSTTSETEVRLKTDATAGVRGTPPDVAGESAAAPPAAATSAPPPRAAAPALAEPPPVAPAPALARRRLAPAAPVSKPVDTDAVARTGRITVRTTPAGARVTIDGRDVGKAPLTIPNLTRGTHTVRIMRDGYTTVERRVEISAGQPSSTITLNLARTAAPATRPAVEEPAARQTASVLVESRPSGATVFIDGKRIGTTPMAIPSVSVGSHAVRMEMSGFKPWTASVRVVAGEKNRVAASLEQ